MHGHIQLQSTTSQQTLHTHPQCSLNKEELSLWNLEGCSIYMNNMTCHSSVSMNTINLSMNMIYLLCICTQTAASVYHYHAQCLQPVRTPVELLDFKRTSKFCLPLCSQLLHSLPRRVDGLRDGGKRWKAEQSASEYTSNYSHGSRQTQVLWMINRIATSLTIFSPPSCH